MIKYILILVSIFVLIYINKQVSENFDEQVNYELQERAGPMTKADIAHKYELNTHYPTIPTYFSDFRRFNIEIFEEPDFKKPLTRLKDATETFLSVQISKPIRSIRIRSIHNDNWRFLQFFSVVIYLKNDKNTRIIFSVPESHTTSESIHYQIRDTKLPEEKLEWLNNNEPKILYFATNTYNPSQDLFLF